MKNILKMEAFIFQIMTLQNLKMIEVENLL